MLTLCSLSFWTQSRTTTYDKVLLTCRVRLSIATNPTQKLLHTYDQTFISQMFQESVMLTVNLSYHKFTLYQCNTLQGLGQPISLVLPLDLHIALLGIDQSNAYMFPLCGHPMVLETLLSHHVFFFFFLILPSSTQLYAVVFLVNFIVILFLVHIAWSQRPLGTFGTNIHEPFTPAYFTLVNQVLLTAW